MLAAACLFFFLLFLPFLGIFFLVLWWSPRLQRAIAQGRKNSQKKKEKEKRWKEVERKEEGSLPISLLDFHLVFFFPSFPSGRKERISRCAHPKIFLSFLKSYRGALSLS